MPDTKEMMDALDARVARHENRRAFFTSALGAAAIGAGAFAFASPSAAQSLTDADVLNFALNLEYLEANFYSFAVNGTPIPSDMTTGTGRAGVAYGGQKVNFTDPLVRQYAKEIAADELAHVTFLRTALGSAAVAQPRIDVGTSPNGAFTTVARAAGVVGPTERFNPYLNDENFLLGAFIFEDVGVTAYKGASPLITNTTYLDAAAGILAVEAYHAGLVRTVLTQKGLTNGFLIRSAKGISDARDSLDGTTDLDQGINMRRLPKGMTSNVAPLDPNGLAFSRTTGQVLNIAYINSNAVTMGGFFPRGVNGTIITSAAN